MVYPLGLSSSEMAAFEAQLRTNHVMRVRAELRDMAHGFVSSLASSRIGGSVQIAADSEESTRSLSLELFDPTDMLGLEDGRHAVTMNRMVQVWRGVYVESLSRWVDVPVFCGPITKPSRSGDTLTIEAQDKVSLAINRSTGPSTVTVKKGTNAATAIRQVMRGVTGESRFRLASTSKRLTKDHAVSREQSAWALVQRICRMLGWVCFYDGAGYLVCKPRPSASVMTFNPGPGGMVTSEPTAGYWDSEVRNQVTVIGGVVSKTTVTATTTLPVAHALSPEELQTGNPPQRRFLTEFVEDSDIAGFQEAKELSARRLREMSVQQTTCSVEVAHVPHLQEHDPYRVPTGDGLVTARLDSSTLQLSCDGNQTLGYLTKSARQGSGLRVRPKSARLKRAEAKVRRQRR